MDAEEKLENSVDQARGHRSRFVSLAIVLVPLSAAAIGLAFLAGALRPAPPAGFASPHLHVAAEKAVVPPTPWLTLAPRTRLDRIGIGSCLSQRHQQPIWDAVLRAQPQLFLMIGDNVYGDIKSPDLAELVEAYRAQAVHPEFARARAALPFLGVWDDHDYGKNDAGGDFSYREASANLFRAYWQLPAETGRKDGVYYSRTFGPPSERVQIIMLDTRSFRSVFRPKRSDFPYWGKYEPDYDLAKTMLGAEQWRWLEEELKRPAEIRLIVSSIQVLADGHGFERWGNLPHESERLTSLIVSTGAKGVVLLSGDRHAGALYGLTLPNKQFLPELTSSSLNRSYGPSKDARMPSSLSAVYHLENFGMIGIDWAGRKIELKLKGLGGDDVETLNIRFADLGIGP